MSDVKGLVSAVARLCWRDGFIDGGDLQELLVKYGCITLEVINEPCSEECVCADCGCDFPTKCYRLTPEFKQEDSHE